jgi:hypothetical protein
MRGPHANDGNDNSDDRNDHRDRRSPVGRLSRDRRASCNVALFSLEGVPAGPLFVVSRPFTDEEKQWVTGFFRAFAEGWGRIPPYRPFPTKAELQIEALEQRVAALEAALTRLL